MGRAEERNKSQKMAGDRRPPGCICPWFKDISNWRVGDLACPIHGVDGPEPTDGPWDDPRRRADSEEN